MNGTTYSAKLRVKFDKEVSNIKIFQGGSSSVESYTYNLKRKGIVVTAPITVSSSGTCNNYFDISTKTVRGIGNLPAGTGILYNIGGDWFDEMEINASGGGGSVFNFCINDARN
ncbi:hypothetical protein EU348_00345 [Chryseobacterium indologenes]|uniref:PLAT domain-containing protein n=1 Tax=Chryseobacterium indologenes TaxID=253 RepID=A0A411DH56_CHRID|nr:hypothetical protein EU348_00345 [Chryseobacterium indologenes]